MTDHNNVYNRWPKKAARRPAPPLGTIASNLQVLSFCAACCATTIEAVKSQVCVIHESVLGISAMREVIGRVLLCREVCKKPATDSLGTMIPHMC